VHSPWTTEQMRLLNQRQSDASKHPYTCSVCGAKLEVWVDSLHCTECWHSQGWCHAEDVMP
jgi:hypothetical protein